MNIGDKVRFTHGKEKGVIVKILQSNQVEVEIEDGFKIPVRISELTLVSEIENKVFGAKPKVEQVFAKPQISAETLAHKGVFMAFLSINDRELSQYLINNTDWEMPFTLTSGAEPHLKSLASGVLKPKTTLKIQDLAVKDFDDWGVFCFMALYSRLVFSKQRAPLVKLIKFRTNTFFKNKQKAPLLDKDAHLFVLDDTENEEIWKNVEVNDLPVFSKSTQSQPQVSFTSEQIVAQMFEKNKEEAKPEKPLTHIFTIDLHAEKLVDEFSVLTNKQIFELQLETFETNFEKAIVNGLDEIIFVHGVGNGTLRTEIHKRLSQHKNVKFYEDVQKERFGYGATKVAIK
ncbi:MAG: Smr/MutS family protein [Pseudarcicella sp.]|nr:Smr/MutS family protein [Pseudarcicella sp.]MBP6410911.1 Smr/MutS family protein [Pseudarcicella sp.]